MRKNEKTSQAAKKKLVLRKDSIRAIDNADLSTVAGGGTVPPDGGPPTAPSAVG